jgi:plastocyanin
MTEYEEVRPNKPALAILAVVGIIIALSITAMLVVPGLQPHLVPVSQSGSAQGAQAPPTQAALVGATTVTMVAPAGAGINQVNFSPANVVLVIGVNNTIVLKNEDTADHTITSNPGDPTAFDTGDISGLSSSDPITITTPGTYAYHCQFHPAYMHGTITVLASSKSTIITTFPFYISSDAQIAAIERVPTFPA